MGKKSCFPILMGHKKKIKIKNAPLIGLIGLKGRIIFAYLWEAKKKIKIKKKLASVNALAIMEANIVGNLSNPTLGIHCNAIRSTEMAVVCESVGWIA